MNALTQFLSQKKKQIFTLYFTAGYPKLEDTIEILETLNHTSADIIEVGMPYSDPLADGLTIQQSSQKALQNGMQLSLMFEQLAQVNTLKPILLMGYFNQFLQYGEEEFCKKAKEVGVSGMIFPDMPLSVYEETYQALFDKYDLSTVFLITPQTKMERIKYIDSISNSFIYAVSSSATTGATTAGFSKEQLGYFRRLKELELKHPIQIGFGISDKESFDNACLYVDGAIIGSAFINKISNGELYNNINEFTSNIKPF